MKRTFEEILKTIDKETFIKLHYDTEHYTQKDLMEYFSIGENTYRKIQKLFGLESRSKKYSYNDIIKSLDICQYKEDYINLTKNEMLDKYHISEAIYNKLRNNLGLNKEIYRKDINKKSAAKKDYNNISSKRKQTMLDRYGVECGLQLPNIYEKSKDAIIEKYGSLENYYKHRGESLSETLSRKDNHSAFWWNEDGTPKQNIIDEYGSIENYHKQRISKTHATKETIYGNANYNNRNKYEQTCIDKYGLPYVPLSINNISSHGCRNSQPNSIFSNLLDQNNISYDREVVINQYKYDFKVDNNLIEINPSATHNSTWSPYGDHSGINKDYHLNKTNNAINNGYRCMHIWDWDNINAIINLLKPKETIYARKCIIKEIDRETAKEFINKYHIQGYANDSIRIGLYNSGELISIMTFGKPRYNSKYDYELVRYCSSKSIIGGAEKLFKYFVNNYNPNNIISYCDISKFNGNTYIKLGFNLNKLNAPSKHWYNMKTKQHITDNLLRQRGFDQLFKTNYGKGTSNDELMLNNGFVEIYDCGQATYIWNKN